MRSGTVLIRAANEGTAALFTIQVALAGDTDGDGIPDDIEVREGLNPNNPADALEDFDRDGLSNRAEIQRGTQIRNADTDADGIADGEEVAAGADGFITNPLLADSDGDGVRDALEIATGSDPTNPASLNLAQALSRLEVTPATFVLTVNSIIGEASVQLLVTGHLTDQATIDLTSTLRGTNYTSSDLNICNFGSPDGRVFAASNGACTIRVTNSGFSAEPQGTVNTFTPTALSFVSIPGFANNVDVSGNFAYVAAGSTGLQVVNISNRTVPVVVAALDTPGNANDVRVVGNLAFIADGASGLQIIDITNPLAPTIVGALDTAGDAWDVVVRDNKAYVADGAAGLRIIDVSVPTAPRLLGSVDPPGTQKGVDVDPTRQIAVLASGAFGINVVDVSNPSNPTLAGSVSTFGDARDVALKGSFALVADFSSSFTAVDVSVPQNPVVSRSTPSSTGGLLQDVTVAGDFGLGADVFFVNGVPIIDIVDPANPIPRAILNFGGFRDDDGQGIAADGSFVYLAAVLGGAFTENGTSGDSRLYIGQYLALEDRAGVAPTVEISAPAAGSTFVEGTSIPVRVEATDDVAVVAVSFFVNGQVVFTDTTSPYEFSVVAPVGTASLTLRATAVDLGGNVGTASDVLVTVIPDPGTTVVGRVVDRDGNPAAGATVNLLTFTAVTDGTGRFSITGVPTAQGPVIVTAVTTIDGKIARGRSAAVPPVPEGTTDVGTIVVRVGGRLFGSSSFQGTNPASVFVIDTETGTATLVGSPASASNGLSDVAFNPVTGDFYAMHGASSRGAELLKLDPGTAAVLSRVRLTSARSISGSDAIAFDASGQLYAGAWSEGRLLRVDPQTGIASSDLDVTGGGGNNHLADLAVDPVTGELWASRGGSTGGDGRIVRLNPQTAAVTQILDPPGAPATTAIAIDVDGTMYVSLNGSRLARVDRQTGALTLIGNGFGPYRIAGLDFER